MLEIRRVREKDLPWLLEQRNHPDLRLYFNQYRELSMEDMQEWYKGLGQGFHAFIVWNDEYRVGYVALKDVNWVLRSAEFSIFIIPEERQKGFGRQALEKILAYGFGTLNLEVIHSLVFEFNKAIDIYKKIGFTIDGLLRHTCYKNGHYYDSFYISMLRDEYDERYHNKSETKE